MQKNISKSILPLFNEFLHLLDDELEEVLGNVRVDRPLNVSGGFKWG